MQAAGLRRSGQVRLTEGTRAGGCASKLAPGLLHRILETLPRTSDPNLLVGFDTSDDAGVYRLTPDLAIVQTVDFFTPMVDDPFTFGAIAAANALSDVYAMGGRPVSALSILACPADGDFDTIGNIVGGGAAKIAEAGAALLGGHSVNDPEIKFGYAITGVIDPQRILTNAGACAGDALLLTKKLGTGAITTALKRGLAQEDWVEAGVDSMLRLNREAAAAMSRVDVHGCTDVTGFGLAGHAREMALASGVTLRIEVSRLQFLPGARQCVEAGAIPTGSRNNREFAQSCIEYLGSMDGATDDLLFDPQTSGGLLIALSDADAARFEELYPAAYRIGRVEERGAKPLRVTADGQ